MKYKTPLQALYFDEVIRLHQELGYGEDRISEILPIGHTTASRWIRIFTDANKKKPGAMDKVFKTKPSESSSGDVKELEAKIKRLESQLKHETLRADAFDELINVAEAKFNIPIRKKAGVKR